MNDINVPGCNKRGVLIGVYKQGYNNRGVLIWVYYQVLLTGSGVP